MNNQNLNPNQDGDKFMDIVIPAEAGIQVFNLSFRKKFKAWTPAFAGATTLLHSSFCTGSLCFAVLLLATAIGCKRNPIDRLTNPNPSGALSQSSGIFTIYDGQVKTGGGLGFIPGGINQSIDLLNTDNPRRHTNQIRYTWNGQDVLNTTLGVLEHLFAGFSFTITPDFTTIDAAQAKDLTKTGGYSKLKLFVRGTLSSDTYLKIEGPASGGHSTAVICIGDSSVTTNQGDPAISQPLTSDWEEIVLNVPPADFSHVKTFFTISIQFHQPGGTTSTGLGGTIYLDDIRYEN